MASDAGGPFTPQDFGREFTRTETTDADGHRTVTTTTKWSLGTEDFIAIGAAVVAIITALGMVFGALAASTSMIGLASFSGVGAVIAEIIGARKRKPKERTP